MNYGFPAALALALTFAVDVSGAAPVPPPVPAVVSTAWLADELGPSTGAVAVIDARPSLKPFLTGHIPGAQPLCADNLRSTSGGVPGTLVPWETLHLLLHRLGLGNATRTVVYAEASDVDAAYVATVLRLAGLSQVSILDGGFARWSGEKRPVTTERRRVPASAEPFRPDVRSLASFEDVQKALERKGALLLDARPADQYAAGHIPGAKSRFWKRDVVADDQPAPGTFRPEVDIRPEFEALGVAKDVPVIVYCNSGHQAAEVFYTLKYRLGHPDVRLYDGSWLEWTMRPGTAKEITPSPAGTEAAPSPAR